WNAFGDADDEIEIRIDRLIDRGSRERRRHINHTDRCARRGLRLVDRGVNRNAFEALARFLRVHAGDEAIAPVGVFAADPRVELPGLAGNSLRDDLGALADEDAHERPRNFQAGSITVKLFRAATSLDS